LDRTVNSSWICATPHGPTRSFALPTDTNQHAAAAASAADDEADEECAVDAAAGAEGEYQMRE
jgi:hypothetical protein